MNTVGEVLFEDWLENQLVARNWRPIDLARAAGVSGPTVTRILNGDRKPGPDAAVAIARALGVPPELVFRLAGLLPEFIAPDYGPTIQEITEILRNMPEDERREVRDYALFRSRRRNNGGQS